MAQMQRSLIPFRRNSPFAMMQQQMERMLDDFQRGMGLTSPTSTWPEFIPSVDVKERDDEIEVTAEVPGMTRKDIEITLAPGHDMLVIKGEKRHEQQEEREDYYHSECSYGAFRRMISLPSEVDDKKMQATLKNGVLKVHLQKRGNGSTASKKIEVREG